MPRNRNTFKLTPKQEEHLGEILYFWANKSNIKYRLGAAEYKSNLWDLSDDELIESALEEVIDLSNYLMTLLLNRSKRSLPKAKRKK